MESASELERVELVIQLVGGCVEASSPKESRKNKRADDSES